MRKTASCILIAGTLASCGPSEAFLGPNNAPFAQESALESSWLDCAVETPRFKQDCKLSDRRQRVVTAWHADRPLSANAIGLLDGSSSTSKDLTPRLSFHAEWNDSPRCWEIGPPTKTLTVNVREVPVAAFSPGSSDVEALLRDKRGAPLWSTSSDGTGGNRVEVEFTLTDNEPSQYPGGRSPVPYPLECDLRLREIRLGYDQASVAESLRAATAQLAVHDRLLRKERMLHSAIVNGRQASLCFVAHTAGLIRSIEREHRGDPGLSWGDLPDEARGRITDLLLDAISNRIVTDVAPTKDAAWGYFVETLQHRMDECQSVELDITPRVEAFMSGADILDREGWQNAHDFANDLSAYKNLKFRIETLRALGGSEG